MTLDLVFLAKGRHEYTRESVAALVANTDWTLVRKLIIYTDGQPTWDKCDWLNSFTMGVKEGSVSFAALGGPINIMLDYLQSPDAADVFAKIDNDVIVPPGWLNRCAAVMEHHNELDLLGIEPPASRTRAPWRASCPPAPEELMLKRDIRLCETGIAGPVDVLASLPKYAKCDAVGGIGLFRPRAWAGRISSMRQHSTYGGFTDWQLAAAQHDVVRGWMVPPLGDLFLLDRLPFEPWVSLGNRYQAEKLQRPWTMYDEETARKLAGWWLESH